MVNRIEESLESAPAVESTRRMEPVVPASPPPRLPPVAAAPVAAPAGRPRRSSGMLLGALAALILVAVVAVVLFSIQGGDPGSTPPKAKATPTATATPAAKQRKKPKATPTAQATATATAAPSATPSPSATPASGGSGTPDLGRARSLQLQGFAANNGGDYARGASISRQALDACAGTRQLDPCGYAAFELGRALNRSGQPAAAIPYLEQRLSYGSNPEADKELKDARKKAGKD
jgi:serine/threonine-protein kinase